MTDNEPVEIIKLGDHSSDSNIFSDNEIDNVAIANVIINDSDDKEETCQTILWETVGSCLGSKELFSVDDSPINEGENMRNFLQLPLIPQYHSIFIICQVTGQNV